MTYKVIRPVILLFLKQDAAACSQSCAAQRPGSAGRDRRRVRPLRGWRRSALVMAFFWSTAWPDLIVGVGIGVMNADAAREVWIAAAQQEYRAVVELLKSTCWPVGPSRIRWRTRLEPDSKAPAADSRQPRTAFEDDTGRSALSGGPSLHAPIRPLRELGDVSVLQRISRSPPSDSTRRGTLRELALMPVDLIGRQPTNA